MALKQKGVESSVDAKKRKRVGFATIDPGIEANECIKIFLVKSENEVGTANSFHANTVDLNQFFGEDGKIYGYKDLKIVIWFSMVSFQAYADITFESKCDGGRGITDLGAALQNIFGESLIEKDQFLQTFWVDRNYIRDIVANGAAIPCNSSGRDDQTSNANLDIEDSMTEVILMELSSTPVGLLYSRLVTLVLLFVEGGSPLDVTDPRWEVLLVVKKIKDPSSDCRVELIGFATVYRFYHYPDSTRLRIGQILVFPHYQGQGHGCRLLESVNFVALSENFYDVTTEEPSDYLQYLRSCIDTHRLVGFEPIKLAISSVITCLKESNPSQRICKSQLSPPKSLVEIARQKLKINKKQFFKCWEVLIYLSLDTADHKCMENFKTYISDRVRGDILDKDEENNGKRLIEVPNEYDHDMTFVVIWSQTCGDSDGMDSNIGGDQATQEEQINQLIEKQMADITKIAKKVSLLSRT